MLQIVLLVGKFAFLIILYLFIFYVIRSSARGLRSAVPAPGGSAWLEQQTATALPQAPAASGVARSPGSAVTWTLVVDKSPTLHGGSAYSFPLGSHALAGRSGDMDIYLEDTFVSSKHALFETTSNGLQVEDLRSTNGTQVNGADISEARVLKIGDHVAIGDTVFRVEVR